MRNSLTMMVVTCIAVLLGGWCSQAGAVPGFPSPLLPPVHPDPLVGYAAQQHAIYPQDVILNDPFHSRFAGVSRVQVGPDEEETFTSTVTGLVDLLSMGMFDIPVTMTGPMTVKVFGYTGGDTGTFDTEIISMNLSGNIRAFFVQIQESPSLPSLGETRIADVGGGIWEIDSFFDVFTELSVNGGAFYPDLNGPGRMELVLPEPATLGLLSLGGLALLRRRSR